MSLLTLLKRIIEPSSKPGEAQPAGEFDDAELYEFVHGYSPAGSAELSLAELRKAVTHPAVHALIERHEVVSAFARGALGCGDDDSKLDSMLARGPDFAYSAANLGRQTNFQALIDLVKAEETAKSLAKRVEAQRLLLEQAEHALSEEGVAYAELRAFLRGEMPVEDVISILGPGQTTRH